MPDIEDQVEVMWVVRVGDRVVTAERVSFAVPETLLACWNGACAVAEPLERVLQMAVGLDDEANGGRGHLPKPEPVDRALRDQVLRECEADRRRAIHGR